MCTVISGLLGLEIMFLLLLTYMMKLTIGLRVSLDGESGSSAEKARDDREEAYLKWMLILMVILMVILMIGLAG